MVFVGRFLDVKHTVIVIHKDRWGYGVFVSEKVHVALGERKEIGLCMTKSRRGHLRQDCLSSERFALRLVKLSMMHVSCKQDHVLSLVCPQSAVKSVSVDPSEVFNKGHIQEFIYYLDTRSYNCHIYISSLLSSLEHLI